MILEQLSFHHFGLAVSKPESALALLQAMGYVCGEVLREPIQNVNLILCTHAGAPDVEIIFPTETPGPVDAILAKSRERIYHLCYETEEPEGVVAAIEAQGLRVLCVSPPQPALLFRNRKVSFHYVEGFGLIELLEKEKGANPRA